MPFAVRATPQLQRVRVSQGIVSDLGSPRIRFFRSCSDSQILPNHLDALGYLLDTPDKGCKISLTSI